MIYPTESVNRLDMLSIPTPAQNMLTRLSIATSRNIMQHFYDYSLLVILSRMRGLQLLRFIFKEKEPGNGLRYFDNEGEGPESNGCRFLFLVDCELAHVKEVAVKEDEEEEEEEEEEEDSIMVAKAMDYGLALRRVSAALEDRNRAWESPERVLRTFWGRFVGGDGWV